MADLIRHAGRDYPVPEGSTPAAALESLKMVVPELNDAEMEAKGPADGGGQIYVPRISTGTKG